MANRRSSSARSHSCSRVGKWTCTRAPIGMTLMICPPYPTTQLPNRMRTHNRTECVRTTPMKAQWFGGQMDMITDLIAFRTEFAHPTQLPNRMRTHYADLRRSVVGWANGHDTMIKLPNYHDLPTLRRTIMSWEQWKRIDANTIIKILLQEVYLLDRDHLSILLLT
ncbi:MAG: hypothetical protein F6K37_19190 [Moorea sp. SIO4E2]|uniref:hypothetical protein n=1 Tax=Moorena sp. SIO4E2 TaxID=2607826 RepID=UPI0013BAB36B|nr:hypothetical protein [Moorena sp. SIO4E2]NEQ07994.1 hypothetical protein [Moorena sp. SIO4E2]